MRYVSLVGCLLALAACAAPATVRVGASPRPAASLAATPAPGSPSPGLPASQAPVLPSPSPGVAPLGGVVTAPAGLIAIASSKLIAKTKRQLLALEQQPLADAVVTLLDAAGQPVKGPDGQPLTARTDAAGRYAFGAGVPAGTLLPSIDLGEDGRLQAIAPRDRAAGQAVDIDLVSSLTTGYILDQYVRSQADPLATLDKLPAALEAETRAKARGAIAGAAALPQTLAPATVVATVEALRGADSGFDRQLEEVKRVLVAAGQQDLGSGRPGTEVSIGNPRRLVQAPDGSLYIASKEASLWRLRADGRVEVAAALAGHVVWDLALDGRGRVVFMDEAGSLRRLESDGEVTSLYEAAAADAGYLRLGVLVVGERVLQLAGNGPTVEVFVREAVPGETKALRLLHTYKNAIDFSGSELSAGADAAGRVYLAWNGFKAQLLEPDYALVQQFTLDDFTLKTVLDSRKLPARELAVDPNGVVFALDPDEKAVTMRKPGSESWLPVAQRNPLALRKVRDTYLLLSRGCLLAAGDRPYLGGYGLLARIEDGQAVTVVGTPFEVEGQAGEVALEEPRGVAVLPGGELVVADQIKDRVFKVTADGKQELLIGGTQNGERIPANGAEAGLPIGLAAPSDGGGLYVLTASPSAVKLVDKLATYRTRYRPKASERVDAIACSPRGDLYYTRSTWSGTAAPGALAEADVQGVFTDLVALPAGRHLALARAADGTFYLADGDEAWRWKPGEAALQPLPVGLGGVSAPHNGLACDAAGRLYATNRQHQVVRWTPGEGQLALVAGPGAKLLAGSGVQDGLLAPSHLAFNAAGDLYVADSGHKQVKRIAAADLP